MLSNVKRCQAIVEELHAAEKEEFYSVSIWYLKQVSLFVFLIMFGFENRI